jgi:hypothetical protein
MIESGNLPQPTATGLATMRPPASHDRIEKGSVIRAPVALDCWTGDEAVDGLNDRRYVSIPTASVILVNYLPDSFYLASHHAGWAPLITKPMWSSSIEASGSSQLAANARVLAKSKYVSTCLATMSANNA